MYCRSPTVIFHVSFGCGIPLSITVVVVAVVWSICWLSAALSSKSVEKFLPALSTIKSVSSCAIAVRLVEVESVIRSAIALAIVDGVSPDTAK